LKSKNDILDGVEKRINQKTTLFFDLDGTLVNTDLANFKAYNEAFKIVTNSKTDLEFNPLERLNRENLKKSFPDLTKSQFERIVSEKERLFEKYLTDTTPNKRVLELLMSFHSTNTTVLVTNCRENRAKSILNFYKLTDYFKHLFFRQFNANGEHFNKYQSALNILAITPESVVVIENERREIEYAISANIIEGNIFKFGL